MEPDRLEAGGLRLGRGRTWLVAVLVLVVVAGLVVLRFDRSGSGTSPAPGPTPSATSSAPPGESHDWPTGLPAGTLYVAAGDRINLLDARTGRLTRTRVEAAPRAASLTPSGSGVLVWQRGTSARRALLVDGYNLNPLPRRLATAKSFLPAPGGAVWAAGAEGRTTTRWQRVDADGRATTSVEVAGTALADGSGGLLSVSRGGVRPAYPPSDQQRQAVDVVATGPAGRVTRACGAGGCRFVLHHRSGEADTELVTAVGDDTLGGTLSPTNRLLAVTEEVGGTSTVRVSLVGTGQIAEIFDAPPGSSSDAVWLDDRWLALLSEDQLVLYDATDDRVVTPAIPLSSVGPLAWVPA